MSTATKNRNASTLCAKGALALYDIVSALLVALLLSGAFIQPAYAYVDPSVMTAISTVVLALVLSAIPGKAFDIVLAIVTAFGVCLWAQGLFFNGSLPAADGTPVNWLNYKTTTAVNAVIWLVILAGFVVFSLKKPRGVRVATLAFSATLILVQGVGVASLALSPTEESTAELTVTQEGLFDVSEKNNVIVFCLDTIDTADLESLIASDSDYLSDFTGFTYYDNVTGSYTPTRYAVPYLLIGEWISHDESWYSFNQSHYERSSLLSDISQAGYSIGIYSDSLINGIYTVDRLAMNISDDANSKESRADSFSALDAAKVLAQTALYRDLPWIAKSPFWYYTDYVNQSMIKQSTKADPETYRETVEGSVYSINDPVFYSNLTSCGLQASDTASSGAFRFIHLAGSHLPYVMDENCQLVTESTIEQQITGSLNIVREYISQLKELGLYDNATIIITSDRGKLQINMDAYTSEHCPILLVKSGSQSASEAATPCKTSGALTGQLDYPATLIDAVGGDSSAYGRTVYDIDENETRTRYYYGLAQTSVTDWGVREYAITGDALDFSNWKLTGYYWDCGDWWRTPADEGESLKGTGKAQVWICQA